MKFLSVVEDVFYITGRGCVIVPAIARSTVDSRLRASDPIQIRNADGQILNTHIAAVEILCGRGVQDRIAFLLSQKTCKQKVIKGAEIWVDEKYRVAQE